MSDPVLGASANRLLLKLGKRDREDLRRLSTPVTLEYKRPLYEAHRPIKFVYFLQSGVASLESVMAHGAAAEVSTVGNEGVVGLPILLDDEVAPTSMYMQVAGEGLRIEADAFRDKMARSAALRTLMLRYAHAFFNQIAQTAACVHFHSLEQRCCRWLLMTHDRMPSSEFRLTHEFLAMMLGARRAGVTLAAGALQRKGYIRYKHSLVTILDRPGLEYAA